MAWTDPTTYSVGATASGDLLNLQIRDNLTYLSSGHGAAKLRLDANQSVSNATLNAVAWTVADWNVGPIWASASAAKIRPSEAGIWEFVVGLDFAKNSSGNRYGVLRVDNDTALEYPLQSVQTLSATNEVLFLTGAQRIELTTSQYIEVYAYQNSGAALNLLGLGSSALHPMTNMSARWVSS